MLHAVLPHRQAPQPLISKQQPSAAGLTPQEPLGSFCEFPAINPSRRSQAYRYAYCLSAVRPTNLGNALSKMDLSQGSALTWHEPGGAVGEGAQQQSVQEAADVFGWFLGLIRTYQPISRPRLQHYSDAMLICSIVGCSVRLK
jgi:carotenoid cleavage dioxygenase-like enzyme